MSFVTRYSYDFICPSSSLGPRVVAETEKVRPGTERIIAWMIVPFPTPEGPEMTIKRPLGIAAAPHVRAFVPLNSFPCAPERVCQSVAKGIRILDYFTF